jgi:hypothetical protein
MAGTQENNAGSRGENFGGVITDISDSGMCLLTNNPLCKGEKIIINAPAARTAIVRWSERFDSTYYTVGLEFV